MPLKPFKKIKICSNVVVLLALFAQPLLIQTHEGPSHNESLKNLNEEVIIPDSFVIFVENIIRNTLKEEKEHSLSEGLLRCYENLIKGSTTLPLDDLLEAFPEFVKEFNEQRQKASRPDTQSNADNGFVGHSTYDVSSILAFLLNLKNIFVQCCQNNQLCCAILQEDFNYTWTILADIQANLSTTTTLCAPIALTAAGTISTSGYYCVANDISESIIIDADDVTLDLNGHTISSLFSNPVIQIRTGTNRTVKNGRINGNDVILYGIANLSSIYDTTLNDLVFTNCLSSALVLAGPSTNLTINNIKIEDCGGGMQIGSFTGVVIDDFNIINVTSTVGIGINECENVFIKNGLLDDTNLGVGIHIETCTAMQIDTISINNATSTTMFQANNTNSSLFKNITLSNGLGVRTSGFVFESLISSIIESCNALNITGEGDTFAFEFDACSNNRVSNCTVQSIADSSSNVDGFYLSDCQGLIFSNCICQNLVSGSSGNATAFDLINSSNIQLYDCVSQNLSSPESTGFFITGTNLLLTNCTANQCNSTNAIPNVGAGFAIIEGNASLQNCQSCYNNGYGYQATTEGATIGNSIAIANSYIGFSTTGTAIYHCFSSRNNLDYSGPTNINNASDQVNPAITGPTGPYAGGNITL